MTGPSAMQTYDCEPTLNDSQVLEFCKNGFLVLEGVVPDEVNRRANEFLTTHTSHEPTEILHEDWFRQGVILNPAAAGAVRSLLGRDFGLPNLMSVHNLEGRHSAQAWHRDACSHTGPQLDYLQVFYYPQDCTPAMGPTALLPGSHFLFHQANWMGHYGRIRGAVQAAAPAGSIFLTVYSIWHRRSEKTDPARRNLLKYNYWRTAPPRRDWVPEPGFDPSRADYRIGGLTFREQFRDACDAAAMFFWLCGWSERFRLAGGQGWPLPANFDGGPYGYPGPAAAEAGAGAAGGASGGGGG